jgi:hypothetical protein
MPRPTARSKLAMRQINPLRILQSMSIESVMIAQIVGYLKPIC